jgi:hypothetical protein
MLKHCAANKKRRLSALPNVGPYIYDVNISGFTRSSLYIYDISRLSVKRLSIGCLKSYIHIYILISRYSYHTEKCSSILNASRVVLLIISSDVCSNKDVNQFKYYADGVWTFFILEYIVDLCQSGCLKTSQIKSNMLTFQNMMLKKIVGCDKKVVI